MCLISAFISNTEGRLYCNIYFLMPGKRTVQRYIILVKNITQATIRCTKAPFMIGKHTPTNQGKKKKDLHIAR